MSTKIAKDVKASAARILGEKHCFDCRRNRKIVAFDSPKDRRCKDCERAMAERGGRKSLTT
jgi:hypothetical protein